MKRPQPDLGASQLNSFINAVGHARKLKRLWGTTTINVGGQDVEVLTPRQYYHPADARMGYDPVDPENATSEEKLPKKFVKLFNFLNVYDETVLSSKKGLRKAWLYFNKNNSKNSLVDSNEFVADNLNKLFWDSDEEPPEELKLTTTIVIDALQNAKFTTFLIPGKDAIDRSLPTTPLLNAAMSPEELIDAVTNNYEELWDTCVIWQEGTGVISKGEIIDPVSLIPSEDTENLSPEDPWLNLLSRYALRDYGIPCIVKKVEVTMREALTDFSTSKKIEYTNTITNTVGLSDYNSAYYTSYTVTLEIPYTTFGTQSLFVSQIANDLDAEYIRPSKFFLANSNEYYSQKAAQAYDSSDLDGDPDDDPVVYRPYVFWQDASISSDPRFDAIWIKSDAGNWYIRADAFIRPSDYGLKFAELSEYVFSLIDVGVKKKKTSVFKKIVAAIVFIVAVIYAPWAANWAQAVLFGSLVLSVLSVVFTMLGMESWAMAFAEVNKTIEPLVMIASIYLVVGGIAEAANSANGLSPEAIIDAAGDYITDMADNMIDQIVQGATDIAAGNITANAIKFMHVVAKLGMMPAKMKLADLNSRNKDLRAEYQDLVNEMSREYDVLQGFARVYASPATADWSIYAEVYDLPYEKGGGPMALGNIQRTTKQAIRKTDYSDPIFDNILIV